MRELTETTTKEGFMANKDILDYPETTTIADDDYIVMDSETAGTSKILASAFINQFEEVDD